VTFLLAKEGVEDIKMGAFGVEEKGVIFPKRIRVTDP
jgi:hypothetical protein